MNNTLQLKASVTGSFPELPTQTAHAWSTAGASNKADKNNPPP
ncbi:MAG: hypothetical protein ACREQW_01150 [Candidatus Binatia bacterium]